MAFDDGSGTPRWETWSPADVGRWVSEMLELPQYAASIIANDVDGPTLLELTEETLENPLGIVSSLHRKKIVGHIKLLKIRALPSEDPPRNDSPTTPPAYAGFGGYPEQYGQASLPAAGRPPTMPSPARGAAAPPPQASPGPGRGRRRSPGVEHLVVSAQGATIQRSRSWNRMPNGTPRSASASSDRRLIERHSGSVSMKNLGDEASVYSRYTNPDGLSTCGLASYFGIDSPSFSRGGSFARSARNPKTFPGQQNSGPSPVSYHPNPGNANNNRVQSPRATIGRSPRDTTEYIVTQTQSPPALKYQTARDTTTHKSYTFGTSPRMDYSNMQQKTWLPNQATQRRTPGPADYRPMRVFDSTFCRSMR